MTHLSGHAGQEDMLTTCCGYPTTRTRRIIPASEILVRLPPTEDTHVIIWQWLCIIERPHFGTRWITTSAPGDHTEWTSGNGGTPPGLTPIQHEKLSIIATGKHRYTSQNIIKKGLATTTDGTAHLTHKGERLLKAYPWPPAPATPDDPGEWL